MLTVAKRQLTLLTDYKILRCFIEWWAFPNYASCVVHKRIQPHRNIYFLCLDINTFVWVYVFLSRM